MQDDQKIYDELAKLLVPRAPAEACSIKYSFRVYPDDNGGDYGYARHLFDYLDATGEEKWYHLDETPIISRLGGLALELRRSIEEISGDLWHSMEFFVDLRERRFTVNFDYNKPTSSGLD